MKPVLLLSLVAQLLISPAAAQLRTAAPSLRPLTVLPAVGAPLSLPNLTVSAAPALPSLTLSASPAVPTVRAAALPAAAIPSVTVTPSPALVAVGMVANAVPTSAAGLAETVGRSARQGPGAAASPASLGRLFDGMRAPGGAANTVVPETRRRVIAGTVRARFTAQLDAMAKIAPADKPLLDQVRSEGLELLGRIDGLMARGELDPRADIRTSPGDQTGTVTPRELRVGVYPVAADPFQWAHILIGLRAMAEQKLDKVVFVLAGDDPRKPNLTPASFRHPMGRAVLEQFAPFFEFSSIAAGTTFDGETNIFRLLSLNKKQRIRAFYLVGGDHYRLTDRNGNDDTLPKIEKRLARPDAGHEPERHKVEVVFTARAGMEDTVPTTLTVHFQPVMSFDASSSLVREGRFALMPYAAYQFVGQRRPGLYGIGVPPKKD
ncbi:MAG: hypothetical protein HYZ75_06545 [Elusimicrobia bacterium]|nr:hypothetical protein [Elusimicrobiota bacterium]